MICKRGEFFENAIPPFEKKGARKMAHMTFGEPSPVHDCCGFPRPDRTAYNRDRTSNAEDHYAAVWRSYSLDELY